MKILLAIFCSLLCHNSLASDYSPITTQQLVDKSSHIVVAQITKIDELSKQDHTGIQRVHLSGITWLKGKPLRNVNFLSRYKGLVDFDPKFSKGQRGVFFLLKEGEEIRMTHYSGAAVFIKDTYKN